MFLPVVLAGYWALRRSHRNQNILLLIASYVFYGAWDYRFLSLLALSTVTDYLVGLRLAKEKEERRRKVWLGISLFVNLGILAFFKYFGFFVDSARVLLEGMGLVPNPPLLDVLLPVGISFYTFQTISYTFDIYRRRIEPTTSLIDFGVYVAYFPQLVAGPIERARHLLPQITRARSITAERLGSGVLLILLGLFKKVAIADVMAGIATEVFLDAPNEGALSLLVGLYAFSLQIYGDFSGYTDIARGSSRLLGIELMENFRQPYLSRNITEFWRTWHISLSNWLRDYLYIPLGGNRQGRLKTYRNLMLTMLLGGLWHGAAWTFVFWGGLHGLYLTAHRRFRSRATDEPAPRRPSDLWRTLATFHLVALSWIFFRAENFTQATSYLRGILTWREGVVLEGHLARVLLALIVIVTIDLWQRNSGTELFFARWNPAARGAAYAAMLIAIVLFSGGRPTPFIYFRF